MRRAADITLDDGTKIDWEPGGGGQRESSITGMVPTFQRGSREGVRDLERGMIAPVHNEGL